MIPEITKAQEADINVDSLSDDEMITLTELMLHKRQQSLERKMKELEDNKRKMKQRSMT